MKRLVGVLAVGGFVGLGCVGTAVSHGASAAAHVRLDSVDRTGPEIYDLSGSSISFNEDENSGPLPFVWSGRMRTAATVEASGYAVGFATSATSTIPYPFSRFGAEVDGSYTLPFTVSGSGPLPSTASFVGLFDGSVTIGEANAIHLGHLSVGGATIDLDVAGRGVGTFAFSERLLIDAAVDPTSGRGEIVVDFLSFSSTLVGLTGITADFASTFELYTPASGSLPDGFSISFDGLPSPPPTLGDPGDGGGDDGDGDPTPVIPTPAASAAGLIMLTLALARRRMSAK